MYGARSGKVVAGVHRTTDRDFKEAREPRVVLETGEMKTFGE